MAPKRARGDEAAPKPESSSTFAAILPPTWKDEVGRWLAQDMPKWDIGGFVVGELSQHAMLLGKSEGVLAGVPFATQVFHESGCGVEWLKAEGHYITAEEATAKQPIARVTGPTRCILIAERTALNILSRASGVASAAHAAMAVARQHKWHGKVAGTRKTTPGFGLVEKYALLLGGADTHRMDLSHMVMLKDNHIWSTGSISGSVAKARLAAGFSTKIEVECTSEQDAIEAAEAGADVIMLDNYSAEELIQVAKRLKAKWPHLIVEASGGITIDTMSQFFSPYVDIISQGSLTSGDLLPADEAAQLPRPFQENASNASNISLTERYSTLDFSLKVPKPEAFASRARKS